MKSTFLLIASLLLAATPVFAEPEIKGTPAELAQHLIAIPRTVSLVGEAEIKVPADRAITSIRVVTESKSLQEASRLNQELRAKMLGALAEKGIPADRVQASKFSSTPKYGVFGEKPKSYRVENVVKITTHDEKEFQAVAKLVDTTAEFRHESIEFERSDKETLKKRALEQAIDKATEKKRLYEEKLGVKLTPRNFEEVRATSATPLGARRMYAKTVESAVYATDIKGGSSEPAEGNEASLPTSFDELVFKAQVIVEYAVESK
jgi:uncharacterized protein YggE